MRPRTFWSVALGHAALLAATGCGFVSDLLARDTTTVRLVNNSDFAVEATLYIDEHQDILRNVLTEIGTRLEFTIAPGETATFSRSCADLQAIVVERAKLRLIGQVGPEAESGVLRDGEDFGCGDTILFTFDHSAILTDFAVSTAVER